MFRTVVVTNERHLGWDIFDYHQASMAHILNVCRISLQILRWALVTNERHLEGWLYLITTKLQIERRR